MSATTRQIETTGAVPAARSGFGVYGAPVTLVGTAALVVSLTAAPWLDFTAVAGPRFTYSSMDGAGFVGVYFGWLGWLLAALTIAASIASCFPIPHPEVAGIGGFSVGIVGIGFGTLAINRLINQFGDPRFSYGPWLMLAGFLVTGISGVVGAGWRK